MPAPYQVWVRSLSSMTTKFRVSGIENARRLHAKLCKTGLKCTPPIDLGDTDFITFRALNTNDSDESSLLNILKNWPEVTLMFDPA